MLRGEQNPALARGVALRSFAAKLPPAHDEAVREIVRARIECVVNDYLPVLIQSLEAALAEADAEGP